MPFKRDHLVSFCILLENQQKWRYRCNSVTDLHQVWHDHAERVSQVRRPLKNFT